jgi:hypothetical protein
MGILQKIRNWKNATAFAGVFGAATAATSLSGCNQITNRDGRDEQNYEKVEVTKIEKLSPGGRYTKDTYRDVSFFDHDSKEIFTKRFLKNSSEPLMEGGIYGAKIHLAYDISGVDDDRYDGTFKLLQKPLKIENKSYDSLVRVNEQLQTKIDSLEALVPANNPAKKLNLK